MTKLPLLTALTSSALLALSVVPASAEVLEPTAAAFAAAAAAGNPLYELSYSDARAVLAGVQADRVAASAPTTTQDLIWTSVRPAPCASASYALAMSRVACPRCSIITAAAG